ncbi:MAG: prolyl oligopeptidase family serine peptidase [Acidobacteriota bacterium]
MRTLFTLTIALMITVAGTRAEDAAEVQWTIDDVILQESASEFDISPDNQWVVWVKKTASNEKNEHQTDLFLSSLKQNTDVQLTRGIENESSPKWSPDGKLIAFLSSRPLPPEGTHQSSDETLERASTASQLWLMNPFGGEPWHLTRSKREIKSFEWATERRIVFSAQEAPSLYEVGLERERDTSIAVEDEAHEPPVRLFEIDIESKRVTRLSFNGDWIQRFSLSPDGRKAVAVHNRSLSYIYDQRVKPAVYLHNFETLESRRLFEDEEIEPASIRWAPDGSGIYLSYLFSSHPIYLQATITRLRHYELKTDRSTLVDLQWPKGIGFGFDVMGDGFIVLLADGAVSKLARYRRQNETTWQRDWVTGQHAGNIFHVKLGTDSRTLIYSYSQADTLTQWYHARLVGSQIQEAKKFTDLNPGLQKKGARAEVVRWTGARNEQVEGILYYPQEYDAGKQYPLVLMIHGGPAGADFDAWNLDWDDPYYLMTQRNAFVLTPNYHGSSHYGLEWVESIGGGNYYDLEVVDIERGVDHLIERGLADPDKLGVMGWSNGAILTIALTTRTDRYKAASAGAGDVLWTADWGVCEFGAAFDNYYLGASPFEDPDVYTAKSPFFELDKVKTPTIIFFGTEDTTVPTEQGWLHYRALQQLGETDVRFLLFPDEGHSLKKLSHQRRRLEEELAWFDRYLFGKAETVNEALKPDSPLAALLEARRAKQVEQRFGVSSGDALIPETVSCGDLEIGRFEVTRAQFAAFDQSYRFNPGEENLPAAGVTFEQAVAYAEWLSRLTGESYRLGRESELKYLFEKAESRGGASENTLDYWAGYAPNPEDTDRLRQQISQLDGEAPLLRAVGSFEPLSPKIPIFDLGGNAAEWVLSEEGDSVVMGGSADTPADPVSAGPDPLPEYVGFRVVKGGGREGLCHL